MTTPQVIVRLSALTTAGTPSVSKVIVDPQGPITRSIGVGDNGVQLLTKDADLPGDWDLERPMTIELVERREGPPVTEDIIELGGYYHRSTIPTNIGAAPGDATVKARNLLVSLETELSRLGSGRGGSLTLGTLNPLGDDNRPDAASPYYYTNQELADAALDALGIAHQAAPASLDLGADGTTAIDPPGPLDWGNARALPELESLLARVGFTLCMLNDGSQVRIVRLKRAGETITLPTSITDVAEPYTFQTQRSVRAKKIIVTSGRTRTTIITSRTLGSTNALEFVAFDDRTGKWLSQSEWASSYPLEIGPGSISDFNDGPGDGGSDPDTAKQFSRLFSAVRLTGTDMDEPKRFVVPSRVVTLDTDPFAGASAVVFAAGMRSIGADQFINTQLDRIGPAGAISGEGVFKLPPDIVYAKQAAGVGTYASASELTGADLKVLFAHEADTGGFANDYYASMWLINEIGGQLFVFKQSLVTLLAGMEDPDVVKVEAPFLRRLATQDDGSSSLTDLNAEELDDIAKQIALQRGSSGTLSTAVIELRELQNVQPGDADGAITRVSWDVERGVTILQVNQHEKPRAGYERSELAAGRSFAAGLNRLDRPGSSAAESDTRVGSAPSDVGAGSTGLGGAPERQAAARGRELAHAGGGELATSKLDQGVPASRDAFTGTIIAELTESTSVGTGKWEYTWQEVYFNGTSWVQSGRSSATHGKAINGVEQFNDGTGVQGNGIDVDNLPGDYGLQPLGRCIVELRGPIGTGANKRWLFSLANTVDGTDCGATP